MYDVVIIGAGVAGGLIADQLSQRGLKVVILEAGPNEQDRTALMENYFTDPTQFSEIRGYTLHKQAPQPVVSDINAYYDQKGPETFYSPYNRRVGGTTWNWLGTTPRFIPNDFKIKTLYGYGEDWPISYDDLSPWYDKAEKELGIHHDFPLSCPDKWLIAKINDKVFESVPVKFESLPQARNPSRCCGSAICIPICPVQAKYDATIHVNKAVKQGATLIPQAVVFKLHTHKSGEITQASYFDWNKNVHTVTGKVFVLAAHAIESPRLLLQSANDYFPNGLANKSDQVGRNLMDHPIQLSYAHVSENIYTFRGPLQTSGFFGFRDGAFRKDIAAYYTALQNDAGSWPKGSPNNDVEHALDKGLMGKALKKSLSESINQLLVLCGMCEQLPNPENRIKLSRDKFDYYGLPCPEIHYSYSGHEKRALAHMRSLYDFIFKEVNATEICHDPVIYSSSHIIGTLRMGDDPATSVVNKDCQAHEHANLYIAGSSVFPSSGTANPTLTLSALALRLADRIVGAKHLPPS
ncbi:MAG: GMC family oxidoreductase [Gammaproteobacteria bacterium]